MGLSHRVYNQDSNFHRSQRHFEFLVLDGFSAEIVVSHKIQIENFSKVLRVLGSGILSSPSPCSVYYFYSNWMASVDEFSLAGCMRKLAFFPGWMSKFNWACYPLSVLSKLHCPVSFEFSLSSGVLLCSPVFLSTISNSWSFCSSEEVGF